MQKVFLVLSILLLGVSTAVCQTKNFIDQPYIETSAKVDTLVIPDRIFLSILITEKDTKGKTSVEALEAKMETALKNLGIDTRQDLTLNDVASNFRKYLFKEQDVLKSKAYTLLVRDAQIASNVIVKLEENEISNVFLDRVEYSKMEQINLELKSKAISKAKLQAEFMCKPLHQNIGSAIFISDNRVDNYVEQSLSGKVSGIRIRGMSSVSKNFEPAEIEFEKIKVESEVTVKFFLLQ